MALKKSNLWFINKDNDLVKWELDLLFSHPVEPTGNIYAKDVEDFCIDSNGKLIVLERGHLVKNLGFTNSEKDLRVSFPECHFNNVICFGSFVFVAGFAVKKTKTFSQTEVVHVLLDENLHMLRSNSFTELSYGMVF